MNSQTGQMTPENFVEFIYENVINENTRVYKSLYIDGYMQEATDPYMKKAFDLLRKISEAEREVLLLIIRQIMIDTSSSMLGILDGVSVIPPYDKKFNLTYDGSANLAGDLQSILIEISEGRE